MTQPKYATPGEAIAADLISAKANGEKFTKEKLAAFIDVRIEEWNQNTTGTPAAELTGWIVSPEDIYQAYPRKIGKTAAIKAITTILKTYPALSLLTNTKAFAEAVRSWPARDAAFIPHPTTWFNRGSYMDDPKEWQRGHPSTTNTTARDYSKI
jgi:hypothetical protein